jgi:Tfp pilus assembly protein FimT
MAAGSDQSGFSLVGALVSLAILGLAFIVAPPYLAQARSQYDTQRASDDVGAILAEARNLAVARTQSVRVMVDERNRSISVEGGSWRKLPAGIALAGPPPGRDGQAVVMFRPDGSSEGGQLVVSMPGRAVSLLIDKADGRIRRIEAGGR